MHRGSAVASGEQTAASGSGIRVLEGNAAGVGWGAGGGQAGLGDSQRGLSLAEGD